MKRLPKSVTAALLACFAIFNECIEVGTAQEQMSRSPSKRIGQVQTPNHRAAQRSRRTPINAAQGSIFGVRRAAYEIPQEQVLAPGSSGLSLEPIPLAEQAYASNETAAMPFSDSVACNNCGYEMCCCDYLSCLFDWSRAEFWLGLSSFTGAGNFTTTGSSSNGQVEGSYGFQQGFNFASRVPCLLRGQLGAQVGMRFTQSQLDGSAAGPDNRNQTFLTVGLFRRVDYGLQGGLVVDYAHNDWFYKADLLQLRGELSFLCSPCHEFGFRFTDSQQTENTTASLAGVTAPVAVELSALNTYRLFYRHRYGDCLRGLADWQIGWTEDEGTLLATDLETPLHDQLGLRLNCTYSIPPSNMADSYSNEAWNLGVAFVWTPGREFGTGRDYYRPLFGVADNGSLLSKIAL